MLSLINSTRSPPVEGTTISVGGHTNSKNEIINVRQRRDEHPRRDNGARWRLVFYVDNKMYSIKISAASIRCRLRLRTPAFATVIPLAQCMTGGTFVPEVFALI
jgi:hypothetical protein